MCSPRVGYTFVKCALLVWDKKLVGSVQINVCALFFMFLMCMREGGAREGDACECICVCACMHACARVCE